MLLLHTQNQFSKQQTWLFLKKLLHCRPYFLHEECPL